MGSSLQRTRDGSAWIYVDAMRLKISLPLAVTLLAAGCGSTVAFKEDVATIIHGRCVAGLEKQVDSRTLLQEAGKTVDDACTCALDVVADNYSVLDLTLMGDETMDLVFTNAGLTCAEQLAEN